MKVIRVKANVAKIYTRADMNEAHRVLADYYGNEIASLRNEIASLRNELAEANRKNEALKANEIMWQAKVDEAKDKNAREALKLADQMIKAIEEAHAARAEAAELNVELMERGVRIEELERRIEWLQAHPNVEGDFVS